MRPIVGALAAVCLLAGCASSADQVTLPPRDIDRWVLPLDRFMDSDDISANYAETLLMGPCMNAAGFDWDVPYRDPYAANRATSSAVGIRIFTLEIAQEYGYHSAPNLDPGAAAWKAWAYREITVAEIDAIRECTEQVRAERLPLLPGSAQLGNSLAAAAYDAAEQEQTVQEAERAWRDCMAPLGIPDLPASARNMPSPWLANELGYTGTLGEPTADEIRYAVADAICRDDSGYLETFYDVLWQKQAALVGDNADALLRIEGMVTEHREKVAQIISENAPPAPE
ncbi:MAG: hypothetical protein M3Y31_09485 [Gemmatimonadota bacterium]|nr:hypothetical protein [Gemmatimonadota bacterium]